MNTLLNAFTDWFATNWFIILLIVLMIAMLIPPYIRQKKEIAAKQELYTNIKKGTKIITTAGIYGVVQTVEETTDGKVVTILTGSAKNPTTMTIHINAIGGVDNKTPVVESMSGNVEPEQIEVEAKDTTAENAEEAKPAPKKTTAKKSTGSTAKKTTNKTTK